MSYLRIIREPEPTLSDTVSLWKMKIFNLTVKEYKTAAVREYKAKMAREKWLAYIERNVIRHVRLKRFNKPVVIKKKFLWEEHTAREKMLKDWCEENGLNCIDVNELAFIQTNEFIPNYNRYWHIMPKD